MRAIAIKRPAAKELARPMMAGLEVILLT